MTKVRVDFSETEERAPRRRRYKPGDYAMKVVAAKKGKSGEKKTPQITFTLEFVDGQYKGKQIFHNCNLLPQSLWVLRNALEAMGMKIPKKAVAVDLTKLKGKKLAVTIDDDEYNNKTVSRVVDTFPLKDLAEKEADEDEDLDLDEDEDEGDEEETEETEDEEDEDEDVEEIDLDEV